MTYKRSLIVQKRLLLITLFMYLPLSNAVDLDSEPAVMSFISVPFGDNSKQITPTYGLTVDLRDNTDNFNVRTYQDLQQTSHLLKFEIRGFNASTAKLNGLPIGSMVSVNAGDSHQSKNPRETSTEEKALILGMGIAVIAGTTVVVVTSD